MHLSQFIDKASEAVIQVNLTLQQAKMNIATSTDFTAEQKQAILTMLEPTESAISQATQSFVISEE